MFPLFILALNTATLSAIALFPIDWAVIVVTLVVISNACMIAILSEEVR